MTPVLNSINLLPVPDKKSGLYHIQTEKSGPIVMDGIVKNCGLALALSKPLVCARNATPCRSVRLPGTEAGLPVGMRSPVTSDESVKNALGWNW